MAPAATKVELSGNIIDITFSEPIDGFDATDYALTGVNGSGTAFAPVVTGTAYDAATLIARITLDSASMPEGTATLTLVLKAGIPDLSVNQNASVEASYPLTTTRDTTKPTATVTTVAGFAIVVTFDEPVSGFTRDSMDLSGVGADETALDLSDDRIAVSYDGASKTGRIVISENALKVGENTVTLVLKSTIRDLAATPNALEPRTYSLVFTSPQ